MDVKVSLLFIYFWQKGTPQPLFYSLSRLVAAIKKKKKKNPFSKIFLSTPYMSHCNFVPLLPPVQYPWLREVLHLATHP